jgi:RNA recognition motif-containing protein
MNIFVGNLPFLLKEEELKSLFQTYGNIESVKIISNEITAKSMGFGFVQMENEADGAKAIESLNNKEVLNRNIIVNEAFLVD